MGPRPSSSKLRGFALSNALTPVCLEGPTDSSLDMDAGTSAGELDFAKAVVP